MNIKESANIIFKNYQQYSDLSESEYNLVGGKSDNDFPYGGTPPIYICEKNKEEKLLEEETIKKREYQINKSAVSIKEIMEKRRKAKLIN